MRLIDADLLGLTDMEIVMCDGDYKEALKMLINKIEHAPTVDPQPKTGTWINCGWAIACSECNYDMPWAVRNYCPSCGARMKDEGR